MGKYDRIMAVNGVTESTEAITKAIQEGTKLRITGRKPKSFAASVSKQSAGDGLGLNFVYADDSSLAEEFFVIKDILDGQLIATLNKQYQDRAVRKLDCLMSVNGVTGCKAMVDEIKSKTELTLTFNRHLLSTEHPKLDP